MKIVALSLVVLAILLAVAANAQVAPIDAVTAIPSYRISDAKGNSLGTPVYMDPQEIRIPFLPAIAGATMDDAVILSYGTTTRTRDHQPRGIWFVTGQTVLYFDGPDCTGSAFTTYRDDMVVRRAAYVTRDGRLWISDRDAAATSATIQSNAVDNYAGEFGCGNRNPEAVAKVDGLITMRSVGTVQFVGPLSLDMPTRSRSVRH